MSEERESLVRVRAYAEIEITVDVDFGTDVGYSNDVAQAVQDAIGHTGAKVEDVTEWKTIGCEEVQS